MATWSQSYFGKCDVSSNEVGHLNNMIYGHHQVKFPEEDLRILNLTQLPCINFMETHNVLSPRMIQYLIAMTDTHEKLRLINEPILSPSIPDSKHVAMWGLAFKMQTSKYSWYISNQGASSSLWNLIIKMILFRAMMQILI